MIVAEDDSRPTGHSSNCCKAAAKRSPSSFGGSTPPASTRIRMPNYTPLFDVASSNRGRTRIVMSHCPRRANRRRARGIGQNPGALQAASCEKSARFHMIILPKLRPTRAGRRRARPSTKTPAVCPSSLASSLPSARFQSRILPFSLPEASRPLQRGNAEDHAVVPLELGELRVRGSR